MSTRRPIRKRRLPREHGFTLVELLVVIVILGILASIVVFAVGGINGRGEDSAAKADARGVEIAEEHYLAENLGAAVYASESVLVEARMLHGLSELHDVCLRSDSKDYYVAPVGDDCSSTPAAHSGVFHPAP